MIHCLLPCPRHFKALWPPGCVDCTTGRLFRFRKHRILADGFRCASLRAEISGNSREEQYRRSTQVADEPDHVSVWDSNAESIRRSGRKSRPSSWDFWPEERAPKSWDYASDADDRAENWQWWRTLTDDDAYEDDADDEEDSWFKFDIKSVFTTLLWVSPAAVVLLPWLLGSPLIIMMSFAIFPVAQRLLGPLLPGIWRVLLQSWSSPSSKSKQKRRRRSSVSSKAKFTPRSGMDEARYTGFSTWTNDYQSSDGFVDDSKKKAGFSYSGNEQSARPLTGKQDSQYESLDLGGWDELDEDRSTVGKLIQGRKKLRLDKRRRKKEMPLFFRLLIALFPFLQSWGGFL